MPYNFVMVREEYTARSDNGHWYPDVPSIEGFGEDWWGNGASAPKWDDNTCAHHLNKERKEGA